MKKDLSDSSEPHVSLLLATYNGGSYVAEQIDSVLNQSWSNWTLYIRDDGSQDETPAIINGYAKRHPSRIRIVPNDTVRLGVDGNFSRLLEVADGPYFMFCDQDDVWLPRKIARSVECIRSLESDARQEMPLLAYTDLRPVDRNLRELDASAWHYGKHNPDFGKQLNRLLVQNVVFGCTIIMNTSLKRAGLPVPEEAVCYDWWFALVAASLGTTDYVPEATMLYRLHGRNTIGAVEWGYRHIAGKIIRLFDRTELTASLLRGQRQAAALLDRHGALLPKDHRSVIEAYATLDKQGFLARRVTLVRYGLFKTGLVRNVGLLARV